MLQIERMLKLFVGSVEKCQFSCRRWNNCWKSCNLISLNQMRICEILASNKAILDLQQLSYSDLLKSLENAVKMKRNLKWIRSPQIASAVENMLAPLYPNAEFLINMPWEEVDPDLEKLVSLAQEFLATKDY